MSVADNKETLGQEFRRVRLALGLTQPEAAEICGIAVVTISHWENDWRQFNSREQTALIRQSLNKLKRKRKWRDQGR